MLFACLFNHKTKILEDQNSEIRQLTFSLCLRILRSPIYTTGNLICNECWFHGSWYFELCRMYGLNAGPFGFHRTTLPNVALQTNHIIHLLSQLWHSLVKFLNAESRWSWEKHYFKMFHFGSISHIWLPWVTIEYLFFLDRYIHT